MDWSLWTRAVMLNAIHITITQAVAGIQWADYDRYRGMKTHALLGVGDSTVVLQQLVCIRRQADGGLLTKLVRAAASFVLRASRERTEARQTKQEERTAIQVADCSQKIVRAAAKFVLRASREGSEAR